MILTVFSAITAVAALIAASTAEASARPSLLTLARLTALSAGWQAVCAVPRVYQAGLSITAIAALLAAPAGALGAAAVLAPPPAPPVQAFFGHPVGNDDGGEPARAAPEGGSPFPGRDIDNPLIGVLMLTLILSSLAAVTWAAVDQPRHPLAPTWLGWALLSDAVGLFLLALAWDTGRLSLISVLSLYLLIAAWLAGLTALATFLRRWGPGLAVTGPTLLAAVLLAFPVTVAPLHRALSAPTSTVADRTIHTLAYGCPTLGVLDAVRPQIPFTWTQAGNRIMYGLTPLGQDAPWPAVAWALQASVFAGAALMMTLTARLGRRPKHTTGL